MESRFDIGDTIVWIGSGERRIKGFITSKGFQEVFQYFYHCFSKGGNVEYSAVAFLHTRLVLTEKFKI